MLRKFTRICVLRVETAISDLKPTTDNVFKIMITSKTLASYGREIQVPSGRTNSKHFVMAEMLFKLNSFRISSISLGYMGNDIDEERCSGKQPETSRKKSDCCRIPDLVSGPVMWERSALGVFSSTVEHT